LFLTLLEGVVIPHHLIIAPTLLEVAPEAQL